MSNEISTCGIFTKDILDDTFKYLNDNTFQVYEIRKVKDVLTPNEYKQYVEFNNAIIQSN